VIIKNIDAVYNSLSIVLLNTKAQLSLEKIALQPILTFNVIQDR